MEPGEIILSQRERTLAASRMVDDQHGTFVWYELMTPDPAGAKAFYDTVIGWSIGDTPHGRGGVRVIYAGDQIVGGVSPHVDHQGPRWITYVGVDSVGAAIRSIELVGGRLIRRPWEIPDVGRAAMVADGAGAPIYIIRRLRRDANSPFQTDCPGHVAWNALITPDVAAASAFCAGVFGWTEGESCLDGAKHDRQLITRNGVQLGVILSEPNEEAARWLFFFRVANVDAAVAAIEDGGGTIRSRPGRAPGRERMVVALDPQGAEFALIGN